MYSYASVVRWMGDGCDGQLGAYTRIAYTYMARHARVRRGRNPFNRVRKHTLRATRYIPLYAGYVSGISVVYRCCNKFTEGEGPGLRGVAGLRSNFTRLIL